MVFFATLAVYLLVSWNYVGGGPSAQFHFVDLAHSFMDGRLDTDTPRQHRNSRPKPEDAAGYRDAITKSYATGGWNDWASVRELKLKAPVVAEDGQQLQVIRGKFPWASDKSEKKHIFYTTDGYELKVQVPRDLARSTLGAAVSAGLRPLNPLPRTRRRRGLRCLLCAWAGRTRAPPRRAATHCPRESGRSRELHRAARRPRRPAP